MSSESLHAPRERLQPKTITMHQAIVSLMEELEAADWYRQRADDCEDAALKEVLLHNMREEIEQGRPVPIAPNAPTRVTIEGGVERAPCPLADPKYANVTVRIDSVRFDHLAEVAPERLDAAWRVYAGRTVPVATLCEIRDRAATMLRDMGYLAAIQIPPQKIETGGVVTFDVLMARLTAIQVRCDAGHIARLLAH